MNRRIPLRAFSNSARSHCCLRDSEGRDRRSSRDIERFLEPVNCRPIQQFMADIHSETRWRSSKSLLLAERIFYAIAKRNRPDQLLSRLLVHLLSIISSDSKYAGEVPSHLADNSGSTVNAYCALRWLRIFVPCSAGLRRPASGECRKFAWHRLLNSPGTVWRFAA
jgi:hypothetical protein